MSLKDLNQISIERYLRDLSETSQKRCFFVTSLRRLKYISKRCFFCDAFKTSQKHLKKDVFCVTSLRRLAHISKKMPFPWRLWDVSKTSLASIFGFSKIHHTKMISCDFRWVITISDKMDVEPSETLRKWNVLWEQCIDINQVCPVGGYLHVSFGKSRIVKIQ